MAESNTACNILCGRIGWKFAPGLMWSILLEVNCGLSWPIIFIVEGTVVEHWRNSRNSYLYNHIYKDKLTFNLIKKHKNGPKQQI